MKNIVVITIDSLRPDHMSLYGYHKNTTPFLKSLINKFAIYNNAYTNGPSTIPSFIASFTSTYPLMFTVKDPKTGHYNYTLSKHRTTLPGILNKYGYETIAFNTNPYLSKYRLGITTKFTKSFELLPGITIGRKTRRKINFNFFSKVFRSFYSWLEIRNYNLYSSLRSIYQKIYGVNKPFMTADKVNKHIRKYLFSNKFNWKRKFIWIHYMDIHVPYYPPQEYLNVFSKNIEAHEALIANHFLFLKYIRSYKNIKWIDEKDIIKIIVDAYDALVLYIDDQLKELFRIFEDSGMPEDTIIAIFSDHGDEHLEHGNYCHGHSLYEELIKIPFLLKDDLRTSYTDDRIQLLDLSPHLLNLIGIEKPIQMLGDSIKHKTKIYMETRIPYTHELGGRFLLALIYDQYKLIYDRMRNKYELYDLKRDPRENNNIYEEASDISSNLVNELNYFYRLTRKYEIKLKLVSII